MEALSKMPLSIWSNSVLRLTLACLTLQEKDMFLTAHPLALTTHSVFPSLATVAQPIRLASTMGDLISCERSTREDPSWVKCSSTQTSSLTKVASMSRRPKLDKWEGMPSKSSAGASARSSTCTTGCVRILGVKTGAKTEYSRYRWDSASSMTPHTVVMLC